MSLVDAVDEKYSMLNDNNYPGYYVSCSPGKTESGRIKLPQILIMDDSGIDCSGDEERLREMFQDVQELDLMKNRLSSWSETSKIITCSPGLESINLSFNPLGEDLCLPNPTACSGFSSLRTLILNSTGVTWKHVFSLLPGLPRLTELHLGMNKLEEVEEHTETFPNIRIFYFNGNRLKSFKQVLQLGKTFPSVEQLFLIQNGLEKIADSSEEIDPCGDAELSDYKLLSQLNYLNLSENSLCNWSCIECLRHLPSLNHLRIGCNPLFEGWNEESCRFHVIAWLPNLNRLNGSAVDAIEREKAERAFIRHFMDEDEKPKRYFELEDQHGHLDRLAEVDLSPRTTVNVMVQYGDSKKNYNLNIEQTVGAVKKELCGLFDVTPSSIRLIYVDSELESLTGIPSREHLKFGNRGIHSFKPIDGDAFILETKL